MKKYYIGLRRNRTPCIQ